MTIDAHLHVWRATTTYPNPLVTHVSPFSDVPIELFKEYMDELDVAGAVLVQPLFPGTDNSYVADCAANEPNKFAAVCVVDPRDPDAPNQLRYWANERGCRGIRIRPRIPGEETTFGDPSTFPLWEQAIASNVVVSVLANPPHLPTLAQLAERFPQANIVVDHLAHPDVSKGVNAPDFQNLLTLSQFPNVYIKTTGYYYFSKMRYPWKDCWEFFRAVYDRFGAQRLIWGSDFPHVLLTTGYRRNMLLQQRFYNFLTTSEYQSLMHDNAANLYFGNKP